MFNFNLRTLLSYLPIGLMFICLLTLNAHQRLNLFTVTRESVNLPMYFSGIVKPLKTISITVPFDGTVTRVNVQLGDYVHQGDVLYYINSPQLQVDFRNALTNFLRIRSTYQNLLFEHNGNQVLYKNGLISKISYLDAEEQFKFNQLALWDANQELNKILMATGISENEIKNLSINDIEKMQSIITKAASEIKIIAPEDGFLSSQIQLASSTNANDSNTIQIGLAVKKNDVIATIYEMNGLNFKINVNETQFHDIKINQAATITGPAFPSITLKGYVKSISHESNNTDTSAVPTYSIQIVVPKITVKQRSQIQEGMSAEITLTKKIPPSIRIPLNAVIEQHGEYFVQLYNKKTGTIQQVPVNVGTTDATSVEVKQGLSPGDQIVLPY